MSSPDALDPADEAEFFEGVAYAERFFMGRAKVHSALEKLVRSIDEARIPYAIIGAMALNEYGYRHTTEVVDVLLTKAGLDAFKRRFLGRGYVEKHPGSRGLRDTENDVAIDVVIAGNYPGDGKPKSVAFPDPEGAASPGARVRLLPLAKFIELKLASGMTAPHRLRDLADVIEIIRLRGLAAEFALELDPMVQAKFRELWSAAKGRDPD